MAREPTMDPVQVEPTGTVAAMDSSPSTIPANAFISRRQRQGVVHRAVHAEAWEIPEKDVEKWCESYLKSDLGAQAYLLSADPGASRVWEVLNSLTDPSAIPHHRDMAMRGWAYNKNGLITPKHRISRQPGTCPPIIAVAHDQAPAHR